METNIYFNKAISQEYGGMIFIGGTMGEYLENYIYRIAVKAMNINEEKDRVKIEKMGRKISELNAKLKGSSKE